MSSAETRWFERRVALLILVVTLWRMVTLAFDQTELWVDEAQYWLWGKNLDWGYFSKPPLIAFWLAGVTELVGSDEKFWIRVTGSLLHAATAVLIWRIAQRLYGGTTGAWAAAIYITLPFVAVGSWQFSTDTVMLPFFALGLLAWTHLRVSPSIIWALVLGLAAGLGMLGKYAALYLPLLLAFAAVAVPSARIALRDAAIAAITALIVLSPNLIWNLQNGGTTFRHVAEDNARIGATTLNPAAALEFLASQLLVFGPLLLLALAYVLLTFPKRGPESRTLLLLSLPVILLMTVQAARAGANANWAVTAYIAGTALAAATLGPRLLKISVAFGLIITIALPLAYMNAERLRLPNGDLLAKRYLGVTTLSQIIAQSAENEGLDTVVAVRRSVLADLFHTLRDSDIAIHALPPAGKPRNFYQQTFPLPQGTEQDVLFIDHAPPDCPEIREVGVHAPSDGLYAGLRYGLWRVPAGCLLP